MKLFRFGAEGTPLALVACARLLGEHFALHPLSEVRSSVVGQEGNIAAVYTTVRDCSTSAGLARTQSHGNQAASKIANPATP